MYLPVSLLHPSERGNPSRCGALDSNCFPDTYKFGSGSGPRGRGGIALMQKSTGVLKVMFSKIKQLRLATHMQYK